ncbi:unnamed protein product [Ectocarpus sp. CCAP 1310/34]|nr:unnamed protein product [Ectocarpus sp. CCAP 1310/34]
MFCKLDAAAAAPVIMDSSSMLGVAFSSARPSRECVYVFVCSCVVGGVCVRWRRMCRKRGAACLFRRPNIFATCPISKCLSNIWSTERLFPHLKIFENILPKIYSHKK